MPKFAVRYHYLATGMEGREDARYLGVFEAENAEMAMDLAAKVEGLVDGPTAKFFRACLNAKAVS